MKFLSGRKVDDLFDNNSFVDAIRMKDKCEVKKTIRKTCSFHLKDGLNTSVCKWLGTKNPDRFEQVQQQYTLGFEQEIEWLAEAIVEIGLGIASETEINPEPLIHAIRQNRIDAMKFYFWIGGTPHLKTKVDPINQRGGESLIHYAADLDDNHIMMFMIENGADVNAKTTYGLETPMHRAAMSGNQDMVRLLWGCGADINAPRNCGETPLMIATKNSDLAMVYLLIRLGADVKMIKENGQSALDLAEMQGDVEIIEMLSDREAGVEFPMINEFIRFKPASQKNMRSI